MSSPDRSQTVAVFIHGLNTFKDDLLHVGPVSFGRMDRHLRPALEARGIKFVSIDGVGTSSPDEQADIALSQIETSEDIKSGATIHLLGNSMGGLVARVVAARWSELKKTTKLGVVVTWGAPHRGSRAASLMMQAAEKTKMFTRAMAAIGYPVEKGLETFRHYSPQALDEFNLRYPLNGATTEHAFPCVVPLRDVSPYFWGLYGYLHGVGPIDFACRLIDAGDTHAPSDGFITIGSQNWGERHGPYRLDHYAQIGFLSLLPRGEQRERARLEFEKLCDDISNLIKKSQNATDTRTKTNRPPPESPVEVSDSAIL